MRYLKFIDGLRALAVLSVLAYHLQASLVPNGYLGVDVFFVISGFIVSYTVSQHTSSRGVAHFVDFYARRFARILPSLLACLLLTGLFVFLIIPPAWLSENIYQVGKGAFFGISNFQLANGVDYFSPRTEFNPFTHTWSLGVEEQFYLIFPFLFLPWLLSSRGKTLSIILFTSATLATFAAWYFFQAKEPLRTFYLAQFRLWELALGVLCFQILSQHHSNPPDQHARRSWLAESSAFVALTGLIVSFYLPVPDHSKWLLNVSTVATVLVLLSVLWVNEGRGILVSKALELRPIRFVGKISYSLYLWHWPVFVIARWTYGLDTIAQKLLSIAIVLALTMASYAGLEAPVRRYVKKSRVRSGAIVAVGLLCIFASYSVYKVMMRSREVISLSVVTANARDWYPDHYDGDYGLPRGCRLVSKSSDIGITHRRENCSAPKATQRLFALGDSHTEAYSRLMQYLTAQTGIETTVVYTSGCPFVTIRGTNKNSSRCEKVTTAIAKWLGETVKQDDILFLSSLRLPRFSDQWTRFADSNVTDALFGAGAEASRATSVEQAKTILAPALKAGAHVVLEAPKPIFKSPVFRCSDWFNRMNPSCVDGTSMARSTLEMIRRPVLDALRVLAASHPRAHIWDSFPLLCTGATTCSAFKDGRPLFFDGDHVSGYANDLLAPHLVSFIESL